MAQSSWAPSESPTREMHLYQGSVALADSNPVVVYGGLGIITRSYWEIEINIFSEGCN